MPIDLRIEGKPIIVASSRNPLGKTESLDRYAPTHSDDIKTTLLSSVKLSLARHLSVANEEESERISTIGSALKS